MRPKLGVDAVRGDDDVGLRRRRHWRTTRAPCRQSCSKPVQRWPVCTTPGRQGARQQFDKVGAVHAERRVPARGVRHLHRRDRRSVMAEVMGAGSDPRAPFLHRRSQSDPLQMAHAVRRQEHAGADLAERRRPARRPTPAGRARSAHSRRTSRRSRRRRSRRSAAIAIAIRAASVLLT